METEKLRDPSVMPSMVDPLMALISWYLVHLIRISGHFKLCECMLVCAYGHVYAECMYVCVETKAQSNLSLCGMLPTFFFEIWFFIGTEVS